MNFNHCFRKHTQGIFSAMPALKMTFTDQGIHNLGVTSSLPGGDSDTGDSDTATKASAGLISLFLFIGIIVVILVLRQRMSKHKEHDTESIEADTDSEDDVTTHLSNIDDIILTIEGAKMSRKRLVESYWLLDDEMKMTVQDVLIPQGKIDLGTMLGTGIIKN